MYAIGDIPFLVGHSPEETVNIWNTTEQICAFIMKHRYHNVTITNIFDQAEITTRMGFLDFVRNQEYLREELQPTLVAMQLGEVEPPEFIPYEGEDDDE